uniref:tetrahydrofolate synthase n=2 Tax=Biomphalaria glabrata TaxID=6526 RepID=A0A2C9JH03_BIOGL
MLSYYSAVLQNLKVTLNNFKCRPRKSVFTFYIESELGKRNLSKMSMPVSNDANEDFGYEEAVKALLDLQSNAEVIAKIRQSRDQKKHLNVPNMKKYILRSGLTMEQADSLSVIHVSGTKGKGSTCAFCERILNCQGFKTGLFTSPHLIEVRERIRLNGLPISKEMFSKYFWKVHSRLKATQTEDVDGGRMPAYFAFLTVLSLNVFISEHVDVAVMEVGIGGQYDSTNFFSSPAVCGVTSLGLDHTSVLGNTLEEIAWNKAGIFKTSCPAITVPQDPRAIKVLIERSVEIQNPLYIAEPVSQELLDSHHVTLGISGHKQAENASLAIQLYRFWRQSHTDGSSNTRLPVINPPDEIPILTVDLLDVATIKGLSSCNWPGRTQTLRREHVTYYLDGAHTLESIQVCATWFKAAADKERQLHRENVARILIFNSTGDRDVKPFLSILKACEFDGAVFCTNISSTNDALIKTDQINRTVTANAMVQRAEENRTSWDSVSCCDLGHPLTRQQQAEVISDHLDHNFNNAAEVPCNTGGINPISKEGCVKGIGHHQNCLKNHSLGPIVGGIHPREIKRVSHFAPTILEALGWASQCRDPIVSESLDRSSLPDIAPFLKEKSHIQILVTGSLHLVGGVLGIICPDLNDN